MAEILSLSRRTFETARTFFAEHPTVEISVVREPDMGSHPLRLTGGVCGRCGHVWRPDNVFVDTLTRELAAAGEELPAGSLPGDFIGALKATHAWDRDTRSVYCGGQYLLEARPL